MATMNSKIVMASMLYGDNLWNTTVESDTDTDDLETDHDRARKDELLRERMRALTHHERKVLKFRYGLDGQPAHTITELGVKLKMGRFAARALATEIEERLRRPENFPPRGKLRATARNRCPR